MTTPPPDDASSRDEAAADTPNVDLGKHAGPADVPPAQAAFDPYRFGRPDHPVPPEFAPPGYVPDPPAAYLPPDPFAPPPTPSPAPPFAPPPNPYGASTPAGPTDPYAPYQYAPYQYPGARQPPYPHPYQPYPGWSPAPGNNGNAIAAMVLGIVSIPMFFLSFLDLALIIPALVLGIIGLNNAKLRNGRGRSQAITGLVCLVVGAVAATVFTVYLVHHELDCRQQYRETGNLHAYHRCSNFDTD